MARAGLNPERLAQAGLELADEIGLPQVTVAAVARRFHVKPASVYSHVRSSEDLRTRMALCALTELADRAAAAVAGRAGKEALFALGSVYRDYAREHPGRYDAARHPLDRETALASAGVRNAELTRAVLRGYHLEDPDQTHAVRLLGSLFHGYVSLEMAGGFDHSAPDSDASWARILGALDTLLRSWHA